MRACLVSEACGTMFFRKRWHLPRVPMIIYDAEDGCHNIVSSGLFCGTSSGDFKQGFQNMDVTFQELLPSPVGPPAATDWSRPWHGILRDWNAWVVRFLKQYSMKCWSVRCSGMYGRLAEYAANLPPDCWLSRIPTWTCKGLQHVRRPRTLWTLWLLWSINFAGTNA